MSESKKYVLITGGNRGIGRGIAEHLASKDFYILVGSRSGESETAANIVNAGFEASDIKIDISSKESVAEAVVAVSEHGPLYGLINNAGIAKDFLFIRSKEQDWADVIDINLTGTMRVTQAFLKPMMKARKGRIVSISSIVGINGNPGQTAYSASKAALVGFSKSLAKELGRRNILINCISPGFIETDMTGELPEEVSADYLKRIPLGKFGATKDIAGTCRFLLSDDANYITGQNLVVDGGLL